MPNPLGVGSSQGAFEGWEGEQEGEVGSRRAGARREKGDEVKLPSVSFTSIPSRLPLKGIQLSSNPLYFHSVLLEKTYLTFQKGEERKARDIIFS